MQAVVVQDKGKVAVKQIDIPQPRQGEILVKNHAVALNPTDWKVRRLGEHSIEGDSLTISFGLPPLRTHLTSISQHRDFVSPPNAILGCDFAGVVEKLGDDVSNVKVGDRVAGFVHGGRYEEEGSFAEYVRAQAVLVWKVPENVSFEEAAASGGVAPLTAVQNLFMRLKLNEPSNPVKEPKPVLVWGGSTSVGLYAVQLLKLSGYTVLATASEKNWALLKSFGVDSTYDYSDSSVHEKIAKDHPTLAHALDCISENGTTVSIAKSFSSGKGHIVTLLPPKDEELKKFENVRVTPCLAYTLLGRPFNMMGTDFPAMPDDKAAAADWQKDQMPELMGSGKLKSNPILSRDGGINAINDGLDFVKAGKNRAQKLTYKLA
ncbi:hypothetical protein JCM10212_006984 [Sporobolomyces blumeae]